MTTLVNLLGTVADLPAEMLMDGKARRTAVLGDETALNVDVFCPIRADYRHLIANPPDEFPAGT